MRRFIASGVLAVLALVMFADRAQAIPSFARVTGLTCNQCHVQFTPNPDFTMTAKKFRYNAYRTPWVYEKMEAGEEGAISGRRLALNLVNYFSMGFENTLMDQSKATWAPGTPEPDVSPIFSNVDGNLSSFYAGPITDHIGVWNEIYYTAAGAEEDNPFRYIAHDEIDLRIAFNPGGNIVGFQFTSEPLMTTYGFQFKSTAPQHEFRGGTAQAHTPRLNMSVYGFWKDRLLTVLSASPGENNGDWDKSNFTVLAAYAFLNKDEGELWYEGYVKAGNDAVPALTNVSVNRADRSFSYRSNVRNLDALTTNRRAYGNTDIGDFIRMEHQIEYGFIDRGPWSARAVVGFGKTHEEYADGGKFDEMGFGTRVRWNYDRTWEWEFSLNKRTNFQYTDPRGVEHDIEADLGWNARFHRRLAMNFVTFLVAGNSQTFDIQQNWNNGWSWSFGFDYYF